MKKVFIVEVELGPACTLFVGQGVVGGFVSCAVRSDTIHDALNKCESALLEDGYEIFLIESANLFDLENYKGISELVDIADEAGKTGEVVYSVFHTYERH